MKRINWKLLLGSVVSVELVGVLAGLLSGDSRGFYAQVQTPAFSPSGWVFGVVWPILYAMMGVALYLVIESSGEYVKKKGYRFFGIQLFLNFLWPIVFSDFSGCGRRFLSYLPCWFLLG